MCLVRVVVPVAMLLVLAVGLGYFRLLQGPASLKFLVAPVERGIKAELDGLDPKVDDVVVTLLGSGRLEFQLKNLRFTQPDGGVVASAPFAAMQLSPSALWSAKIVPSKVVFIEPRVFLAYSKQNGLTLRFSQTQPNSNVPKGLKGAPVRATKPVDARAAQGADGQGWQAAAGPDQANTAGDGAADVGSDLASSAGRATQSIDVARLLTEATRRASGNASNYLRELGFRDATVVVDHEGHLSAWQVPRLAIDLEHRRAGSIVSGYATVSSGRGPWSLSFRLEDSSKADSFAMTTTVRGLVPRTVGEVLPTMRMFAPLDLPIDADAKLVFTRAGILANARLDLEVGAGRLNFHSLQGAPLRVDAGLIRLDYDAQAQTLIMGPSTVRLGESSLTLAGQMKADPGAATNTNPQQVPWRFDVKARQGVVGAAKFGVPPLPIDTWTATGNVWPSRSVIDLTALQIGAGDGHLNIAGKFDTSPSGSGTHLEGKISTLPAATLKAFWPRGIAEAARNWVGRHIDDGRIKSGTIKYIAGRYMREWQPEAGQDHRLAMAFELADVTAHPILDAPEVSAARALVRLENNTLEVVVPDALVPVGDGKVVPLKSGRFTVVNLDADVADAELVYKVQSDIGPVLTLLEHPSLDVLKDSKLPLNNVSGKLSGDMRLNFPTLANVTSKDVRIGGKLRLTDGRAKKVFGNYDIQGATLDFDLTEGALDTRGEILLAGVLAKLNWQRIFAASDDQQPPLRITATLDNSDRRQLGLKVDEHVSGNVPVELTVSPDPTASDGKPKVHVRTDLTNADLRLNGIGWQKRPGRSAFLEFDVVSDNRFPTLLSNLKIAGDDLAIEGWAGLNADAKLVEFEFPAFSLDLVTRLKVSGKRKPGPVWDINAKGSTYDGRAFFQSLFSVGKLEGVTPREPKPKEGVDLTAKIDTVIGFEEMFLKGLSFKMSKRGGKLKTLRATGELPGGKPLNANFVEKEGVARRLVVTSSDAGEVFRLVGFYPSVRSGKMRLEVQLDGRGAAEKTGTLWVEKFRILGDPVVSEVFSNVQDGRPSIAGGQGRKRNVVHEVFPFDQMRAPFSLGHGQFVLQDAYLRGPILGATLRGKIDYTRKSLNIGGTYVPAQGLNNIFYGVPIVGEIFSGPRGEGIFGITFAIQGAMNNPQVIVNPLSLVAPGIFREIFQMTPYDPRVQARPAVKSVKPGGWDVRSSSVPVTGTSPGKGAGPSRKRAVDGWSARGGKP